MYHYAGNNPINYTDPDGRFDWKCLLEDNTQILSESKKSGNISWETLKYFADIQGELWATGKGNDIINIVKAGVDNLNDKLGELDVYLTAACIEEIGTLSKMATKVTAVGMVLDLLLSMKETDYEANAKSIFNFTAQIRPYAESTNYNGDLFDLVVTPNNNYTVTISLEQKITEKKIRHTHTACWTENKKIYSYTFTATIVDEQGNVIKAPKPLTIEIKETTINYSE